MVTTGNSTTTPQSTITTEPVDNSLPQDSSITTASLTQTTCFLCEIDGKNYCCEDCNKKYCVPCFETHECYIYEIQEEPIIRKEKAQKNPFEGRPREMIELSKKLSNILRHNAIKFHIPIRSDGYVQLSCLLAHRQLSHTNENEIRWVVSNSDKQRFQINRLDDGEEYIRATQGHSISSIKTDELLEQIHDPSEIPVCMHGTYLKNLPGIMREGLKRCSRNHIHMANDKPNGKVISGARVTAEVFIHIDTEKAMLHGLKFYRSANGVILTEGPISPDFFKEVEIIKSN